MQRRSDSIKFLEVYDPDTGREGTDVVGFFQDLTIGDIFQVDDFYPIDAIIDFTRKNGILISQITGTKEEWTIEDKVFEVTNFSDISFVDRWYNETICLFTDLSREERMELMDRIYKKFCAECMAEAGTCDCAYGPSEE